MKKYFIAVITLFIFSSIAYAQWDEIRSIAIKKAYRSSWDHYRTLETVASGSCTKANIRISGIDGTAFIDISNSIVANNADGYRKIVVADSSSNELVGYLKAPGTSETLGSNLHNDDLTAGGWASTPFAIIVNATTWKTVIAGPGVYRDILTQYECYKVVADITPGSGTISIYSDNIASDSTLWGTGNGTHYGTSDDAGSGNDFFLRNSAASASNVITNLDIHQVTAPSATGATIVSAAGGSTQNWTSQDASFNYNDASGYTYIIYNY